MATTSGSKRPVRTLIRTRYMDESGEVLHTAEYKEEMRVSSDGITSIKEADNSAILTGELHNASMSSGSKPILMLALCPWCRDMKPRFPWQTARKTHGLFNASKLKHCCDCGQPTCPRHRTRSRYDRQWRCPRCHKKHVWMLRLKALFFKRVER